MTCATLDYKPPFPYFGGKSTVAHLVWERLGDVPNYVEPFFGSGAVLFMRPTVSGTETVNDKDGMLANFWRAVQKDSAKVAEYADWPVNENDLHARHAWLVGQKESLQARLEGDADYFDAKIAGWWVWGISCWIGSGWCSGKGPWRVEDGKLVNTGNPGKGVNRKLPHLGNPGQGVNRQLPHLRTPGQGVNRKLPHLGNPGKGVNRKLPELHNDKGIICESRGDLAEYLQWFQARLRRVRVCCGDWSRVCGPSVTWTHGITGVFLDPPYSHAERDNGLYTTETDCSGEVREWALANGDNPLMRIALCGYEGEHAMPDTWECVEWKGSAGYSGQNHDGDNLNRHRERIWFSPACLRPKKEKMLC